MNEMFKVKTFRPEWYWFFFVPYFQTIQLNDPTIRMYNVTDWEGDGTSNKTYIVQSDASFLSTNPSSCHNMISLRIISLIF